jgi:serine/threonine-protein kinase
MGGDGARGGRSAPTGCPPSYEAPVRGATIVAGEPAVRRATIVASAPAVRGATIVAPAPAPVRPTPPPGIARASAPPSHTTERADGPVPLHRGARLGRWILDEQLGEGATASVWSAHHEQLGAPVAIKVFHRRDLPFQTVLGEARAAAGIPSRNAIWVYDVDTLGGHHAIVMELCADEHGRATSLRDAMVDDPRIAARILAEAARGVDAAHACDVFHKDIKPANVLLNPADGRAQIADFGLANPALWQVSPSASGRTVQGTVLVEAGLAPADEHDPWAVVRGSLRLGTPEFMAPEQAAGLRRDLDPSDPVHRRHLVAIDVYGLGATLWYLLVGRPPYPLEPDPQATSTAIMDEVVAGPPEPLARAAPKAPWRLARIVERAMHRDPLQRYPTAGALADDLEAWLSEHPTSFDTTRRARARVHLWRERARVGLLAALAAVTIGSSLVVADNARQIATQRDALAQEQAALASVTVDKARALADLAAADAALRGAADQLQAKEGLLLERGAEIAERDERIATTSQMLSTTREELTTRSMALDEALSRLAATEDALRQAQSSVVDRQTALDRARADLVAAAERRDELGREVASLGEEVAAQRAEVDRLARAEERARQHAATLETQLRSADAQVRALKAELQRAREAAAEEPPLPPPPGWQQLAPASQSGIR